MAKTTATATRKQEQGTQQRSKRQERSAQNSSQPPQPSSEKSGQTKTTRRPPTQPSDEATQKQLKLAKKEGDAYGESLKVMTEEVARGREQPAGDYIVGYAVEAAEGMYHLVGGKLEWAGPQDENAHVEVAVRDGADGRFIPQLTVYATLIAGDGTEVGTHQQPFVWHPGLYHYGRNWRVPGDGAYTLRVRIEAPEFHRHDKINGQRYAEPVEVEFSNVEIQIGKS